MNKTKKTHQSEFALRIRGTPNLEPFAPNSPRQEDLPRAMKRGVRLLGMPDGLLEQTHQIRLRRIDHVHIGIYVRGRTRCNRRLVRRFVLWPDQDQVSNPRADLHTGSAAYRDRPA